MQVEIQKRVDVPLLNRERVSAVVAFDGGATPSVSQLKDILASQLKVSKDLLAVRHVYQRFGLASAKVIAHVYKKREDLLRLEVLKKGEKKEAEVAKKEVPQKPAVKEGAK